MKRIKALMDGKKSSIDLAAKSSYNETVMNISGDRVKLRSARSSDATLIAKWKNDRFVRRMALDPQRKTTIRDEEKDIGNAQGSKSQLYLVITLRENDKPIGYIRVNWMDKDKTNAWLRFALGRSRKKGFLSNQAKQGSGGKFMKNSKEHARKILAPCGIYCPECSFKVAYETQNRAHVVAMPAKYDKYKTADFAEYDCSECTPENQDANCEIKQCVIARKLEHCGQCGEFPCILINNFAADGIPHHKKAKEHLEYIRKHGLKKFIKEKEKQIKCVCGEKLSWYVTKCLVCGKE